MRLEGMSVAAIARVSGTKRARVDQAIVVAENELALAVAAKHGLNMEQASAIAEFSEDREAVKELTVLALRAPGDFDHRLSRLRQDRASDDARQRVLAACAEVGLSVIERPEHGDKSTVRVRDLYDGNGERLDEAAHVACAGHAVVIEDDWQGGVRSVAYCTSWREHGHQLRPNAKQDLPGPEAEAERARRREVIERNKAWRAAEPVRLAFVTEVCARRSAPKPMLRYLAGDLLAHPSGIGHFDAEQVAAFLGLSATAVPSWSNASPASPSVEQTPEGRLPLLLFAQVAGSVEATMGVHSWRSGDRRVAGYLGFLAVLGYTLSEVEQLVVERTARLATEAGDEPDDEDGAVEAADIDTDPDED